MLGVLVFSYRYVALLIVFVGMSFVTSTSAVFACSGGTSLTIRGLIDNSDYVVKAHAVESDDASQNVILEVESYLVGGPGPQFLLLNRNDPIITEYILTGHSGGGDCLGLTRQLKQGNSFYIFLQRNANGSYFATDGLFNNYVLYNFPESNSTVTVYSLDGDKNGELSLFNSAISSTRHDVTESEFMEIIGTISGEQPESMYSTSQYPLKAPLLITTQSNKYIQPVDLLRPVTATEDQSLIRLGPHQFSGFHEAGTCSTVDCVQWSPDGLNIAVIAEDETIHFTWNAKVDGQAVLFAPASGVVAVWNDCQLSINTLGYPPLMQELYHVEQVNQTDLTADDCSDYHKSATWSPDGRMLAFVDERGILLWDVFSTDNQPRTLVKNASTHPTPVQFSPQGRYLKFLDSDGNHHIDIVSGTILADGVISPDDHILVGYDTDKVFSTVEICALTPYECVNGPTMSLWFYDEDGNMERFYDLFEVSEVVWKDKWSFLARTCTNDEYDRCALFEIVASYYGWWPQQVSEITEFDYDVPNETLAYIRNSSIIIVNGVKLDTTDWFDDGIQSIEWLPSLFFHE